MTIKHFLTTKNSVKSATIILVVTLLVSNILGLLRDHFLAQKITTTTLDTYYAAFRIPDLIFNVLILGAIAAAFIPVFTEYISRKQMREAWKIANSLINIAIISMVASLVILYLLLPVIIPFLVPKFDALKQQTTLQLARLFLLSPLFFGISYIFGGILNSFKRFVAYSIAPLIYNLSIIVATIFWADKYGVMGVGYGVVAGAFLHLLIQIPSAVNLGYRYRPIALWHHPAVVKIGKLMVPRAIGLGAMQIMLVAYTAIASALAPGSVAIFNLADNIQTMPTVVFGTSFATAVFPTLSESISLGKMEDFGRYIWRGVRAILYILIPISIVIILLRAQIVRLILGSGYFGWEQTVTTANTLAMFAVSLIAQGLIPLFARAFYAQHNTKTPTVVSIISIIISIILGIILSKKMGVAGLALAFTISSFINVVLLYLLLRHHLLIRAEQEKLFVIFLVKIIIASAIMTLFIQIAKYMAEPYVNMHYTWGVLAQTIIAIIAGVLVYLGFTYLFKCEEFSEIRKLIMVKFSLSSKE